MLREQALKTLEELNVPYYDSEWGPIYVKAETDSNINAIINRLLLKNENRVDLYVSEMDEYGFIEEQLRIYIHYKP